MKNLKLTKKVQIVLASILIIAIVAIVVGTMFSNRASAATKPCGDSNCPGTMTASNYGVGTHRWHCNTCSYISSESCSGGSWTHKNGTEVHQKFCWACGYFYTQANCHDDNGDGVCEDCGWDGMHVHSYSTSYVNNNNGTHTEKHTCSCGDSYDGSTVSCSYGNKTSNGNGTHSATCTVCGYNLTEDCTEVIDEGKPATCTEEGLTDGKHCSVCNAVTVTQETIPALGHTEVTDAGKPATCTEEGLTEGKHCSVCEEILEAQETIPALGHTEVIDEGKEATCTEEGLTEGKHCSVCEEILEVQETIPALGHTEVIDEGKEATCTEEGLTEGTHCSVCNEVIVEQEVIPALGHTEVIDEGKEATCTEEGLTEGKHCSVCGEILVAQETIPVKGHNFVDGECTECGEQEFDEIDISSEIYEIDSTYITNIQPDTTVKEIKENLNTNASQINIYDKNNELLEDDDIVGTGAILEVKSGDKTQTFTLIVKGDVNGDGKADMLDITTINQYRLNKVSLEEIYLKAGDVTEDTKVDLYDILKINMYRLHKINEL